MTTPIWSLGKAYFVAEAALASQVDAVHNQVRLSTLLGVMVLIPDCRVVLSQERVNKSQGRSKHSLSVPG